MTMKHFWVALAALLFVGSVVTVVGVVGAQPTVDSTVTDVNVQDDGSAEWTIELRTSLQSDSDVAEFEAYKEDFEADSSSQLDSFESRMTNIVESADENSDREMGAHSFDAEAEIEGYTTQRGVVRLSFVWEGFADVDNTTLSVGDVFDGGYFIADGEQLRIHAPSEYTIESASPEPDERDAESVVWDGPHEFDAGEPGVQMAYSPDGPVSPDDDDGLPVELIGLAALVAIGLAAVVALKRRRASKESAERTDGEGQTTDALVTDEEKVLQVLDSGERVKQIHIRDELGWSDSKTSRVLSEMEERGSIEKLRLGRENVVRRVDE